MFALFLLVVAAPQAAAFSLGITRIEEEEEGTKVE